MHNPETVGAKLQRAQALVRRAERVFDANAVRRVEMLDNDNFLLRQMDEIKRLQKERERDQFSHVRKMASNSDKIDRILSSDAVYVAGGSGHAGGFSLGEMFTVDPTRPQHAMPEPSGPWASKDLLSQKEYDPDAANNQDVDGAGLTSRRGSVVTKTITPIPRAIDEVPKLALSTSVMESSILTAAGADLMAPDAPHAVSAAPISGASFARTTCSQDLATLFNRLCSNDGVLVHAKLDEFNSTQYESLFVPEVKMLSLANGRLLRRMFDAPSGTPHIMYSTQRWKAKQDIMEVLLGGHFGLEEIAQMECSANELRRTMAKEQTRREHCEALLAKEKQRVRHLSHQLHTVLERNRSREQTTVVTAIAVGNVVMSVDEDPAQPPSLLKRLIRGDTGMSSSERGGLIAEIQRVLEFIGSVNTADAAGGSLIELLDDETIRNKLFERFSVTNRHLENLRAVSERDQKRVARRGMESRMAALEAHIMELEDSHSGYNQLFVVGENVYSKMGSVVRVLTDEQRADVFGVDGETNQFVELTKPRDAICPLCRFEFDATKPASEYAAQIEEKTRRTTEELHVLVGRRAASRGGATNDMNGTMRSSTNFFRRANQADAEITRSSRPSTRDSGVGGRGVGVGADGLSDFESQVAIMALQQIIKDLELKSTKLQEQLDEATAGIRLEKMHYATLDSKYKETLRETGEYRKRFDQELKRANDDTQLYQDQAEQLKQTVNEKLCRIDDLEDMYEELNQKLARSNEAERQVNTIRFGYPTSNGQKADLSYQEIGYVYYRKFHECLTQLNAIKKRFNLLPAEEEVLTSDASVMVGGGKGITAIRHAATSCVSQDLVPVKHRAVQHDNPGVTTEVQTDPVASLRDNVEVDEMSVQTEPSLRLETFRSPIMVTTTTTELLEMGLLQFAEVFKNSRDLRSFLDCLLARRAVELERLSSMAMEAVIAGQKTEAAAHEEELLAKDATIRQLSEAYTALQQTVAQSALQFVAADLHDVLPKARSAHVSPQAGVLAPLRSPTTKNVPALDSYSQMMEVAKLTGYGGPDVPLEQVEGSLRAALAADADGIIVSLAQLADMFALLQGDRRALLRGKPKNLTVVTLGMSDPEGAANRHHQLHKAAASVVPGSGSKKKLLPPLKRQGDGPRAGLLQPNTVQHNDGRDAVVHVGGLRMFDFDALCDEAIAHAASTDDPSSQTIPVPPLPSAHTREITFSGDRLGAGHERRFEVRAEASPSLIVTSLHAAKHAGELDVLTPPVDEEPLGLAVTSRKQESDGINRGALAPVRSTSGPPALPLRKTFHPPQRNSAALLAVRLQSQLRLGTPSQDSTTEPDAAMLGSPSYHLDKNLSGITAASGSPSSVVDAREYEMASFLPRPLPQFRGALPPQALVGGLKPPGGFVDGWNEAVSAQQKSKARQAAVANQLSAISARRGVHFTDALDEWEDM